jgi:hypothetical protein
LIRVALKTVYPDGAAQVAEDIFEARTCAAVAFIEQALSNGGRA